MNGPLWSLGDWSTVGSFRGDQALGYGIPTRSITLGPSADFETRLTNAIQQLFAVGGGVVNVQAGDYVLSHSIAVPASIWVRGAGSGKTRIQVPSSYVPANNTSEGREGLFTLGIPLGGWAQGWTYQGPIKARASMTIPAGSTLVTVADGSMANVGDWLAIEQGMWSSFTTANSGPEDPWKYVVGDPRPDDAEYRQYTFIFVRQVIAKPSANQLKLDGSIPFALNPANNPIVLRAIDGRMAERLGVSGMTITFAPNHNGAGEFAGRPAGNGVYAEGCKNFFVQDVQVLNFPRYGFYLHSSARGSLVRCSASMAQDVGGGGYGYAFQIKQSQDLLLKHCFAEASRHNYVFHGVNSSRVAVVSSVSKDAYENDDIHYQFSHAILFDCLRQVGQNGLTMLNRGPYMSGPAWETLGGGAFWNCELDGDRPTSAHQGNGQLHVTPSRNGAATITGLRGSVEVFDGSTEVTGDLTPGQQILPAPGLQIGSRAGANVLYDGYGQAVQPHSLYEAQLANRRGPRITANAGQGFVTRIIERLTKTVTLEFVARVTYAPLSGVIGFSQGKQTDFPGYFALVRFAPPPAPQVIQARKGSAYAADAVLSYIAGKTYLFRVIIHLDGQGGGTYDVFCAPQGGAYVQIALGYPFRTEQQGKVFAVDYYGATVDTSQGSLRVGYMQGYQQQ